MTMIKADNNVAIRNSQADKIVGSGMTTVNKANGVPGEASTATPKDVAQGTTTDLVKSLLSEFMKDGKLDKGEVGMLQQFMKMLSDMQASKAEEAEEGEDGEDAGDPLTMGGTGGSQAPPSSAGQTSPASGQQASPTSGRQTPASTDGIKGGTEDTRQLYKDLKQEANADGKISRREQQALDTFAGKAGIKDESKSATSFSGMAEKLLKFMKGAEQDGNFSKKDLAKFTEMVKGLDMPSGTGASSGSGKTNPSRTDEANSATPRGGQQGSFGDFVLRNYAPFIK